MASDVRRFDLVAETQILLDGEVAHCWELVRAGIRRRLLDPGNLGALIERLRAGEPVALGELALEREAGGDRLQIALEDDRRTCPAAAMLDELERLARRAGASAASAAAAAASSTPPPPATATPRPEPPPPGAAPDLLGLLAHLLGATPGRLAADPAVYRAQLERLRTAVERWREVAADPGSDAAARDPALAELRAALTATGERAAAATAGVGDPQVAARALALDPDQLAGAARAIADWLEQRTPTAGAAVDRVIAALEDAVAPLLGRPTAAEADAERDRRLREEVRASIAARIKLPGSS